MLIRITVVEILFTVGQIKNGRKVYSLISKLLRVPKLLLKLFFKWAKLGLLLFIFVLFSHLMDKFSTNLTVNDKSVDGVPGSQTQGSTMGGADESTELWRHP